MSAQSNNKLKALWIVLGGLLLVFGIRHYSPRHSDVPDGLIGEWHCADPAYEGRSLEIEPITINFGTGAGSVVTGFIKNVSSSKDGNGTLYTFVYTVDDADSTVSFYYQPGKPDTIRFKNQRNIVWTRD
ncbi:MAG: hypothetical protein JO119_20725 [Acidobacteria bacterium]|nr:hypothetical protein [Acidobacteriota bacterium]